MRKIIPVLLAILCINGFADTPSTDTQIKQQIIDESIATYHGNCPCPYHTAKNGSRCGQRSAYARKGRAELICYPRDVTEEMLKAYKQSMVVPN
jgi:hypothetical protein